MRNWLLPEYIEDVLPAEAARIETLRRKLLDLFKVHGYQYVIPPMLEYMESLITGVGHDLDLATFKVVDQLTGRLMGVRADMTPQAARIDAHLLNHQGTTRLCYAGSVLRTKPDGLAQTREPLQLGAELYGHAGIASDIEIQRLLIKALHVIGIEQVQIDFSHVNVFGSLIESSNINPQLEQALYAALQSKDQSSVAQLSRDLDKVTREALLHLTELNGDQSILAKAGKVLPATPAISSALQSLQQAADGLQDLDVSVSFDLSELRGYHYHSGIVFAAYAQGYKGPLALGGRYDEVGQAFGRARSATGFSLDLRGVVTALPQAKSEMAIFAPAIADTALTEKIDALRQEGHVVIQELPDTQSDMSELNCSRKLEHYNSGWHVVDIK
ncbi:MAG: ATP phosphoribosyltransferase regulatory subunit [Methylotenera sp. 24-45-7]|jgi:ATP phosphoribosyltransferase regulatory subunit|nr:MAG: ATP phosphoribosyltransferase regulatory subunit [Methylophilales bacterium 16-45-9]OYZ41753.1 MAG: ATP phosphoribosyltransferase regulatory subunit [Methylotenera sp. 24-45-7]OZA08234.1 MAG: ATP phosphoribosyltransferase regulatory subunit [Methylotenera sp. 17-45-7]OZA54584.1 MAG: ATP phosphoribosyltransferase regulatory subunit [Methylophilales bacterium 39-45-7]HQS36848.1 ATP phosphoribosyltransferase regulatory subunit [Methylotenera sp.]